MVMRGWVVVAMLAGCALVGTAQAQVEDPYAMSFPPRPGQREFIVDQAGLIDAGDAATIRQICDSVLTDKAVPIIVVTIDSLSAYSAGHLSIEEYARSLFDDWGIGYQEWNHGILLLVSVGDRKARIELGADWRGTRNRESAKIMNELIVPQFKASDFSGGILGGVRGLEAMARGLEIPSPPRPLWHYGCVIGLVILVMFTTVSLIRRGSSGWAWLFWGIVFTILFGILAAVLASSSRGGSCSSGGFSGPVAAAQRGAGNGAIVEAAR